MNNQRKFGNVLWDATEGSYLRDIILLSFHVRLYLPSVLFLKGFRPKFCMHISSLLCPTYVPFAKGTDYVAAHYIVLSSLMFLHPS
jgi:hypothetical protein